MSVSDAAQPGSVRKAQFAMVPMWVHRRILATRTRTMALAVYVELVGQYAGGTKEAEGLRVWPEIQQIADSMDVPKSSVERALKVLIDCGVVLKKRTMRRNQYWLPQEDPGAFAETLAGFQTVTSDVLDKVQTVTSDGLQTVTSDGLYNPDPLIQTQETHLSLAPVVPKAEDARAQAAVVEREILSSFEDPNPTHPAPLPGVDAYTAHLAAAAAQVPAPRHNHQQPQQTPQTPRQTPPTPTTPTDAYTAMSGAVCVVFAGWAAGAGVQRPPASVRGQLAGQVAELAAEYVTSEELRAIAEFAGHRRWTDLGRAAMHPECAKRLAAVRPGQAQGAGGRERCPDHPARYRKGCMDCAMTVPD